MHSKTLVKGVDYTLSYKDNVKVGTATLVVTGKGNYSGTKTVFFKIVAKKAAAKVNGTGDVRLEVGQDSDARVEGDQPEEEQAQDVQLDGSVDLPLVVLPLAA